MWSSDFTGDFAIFIDEEDNNDYRIKEVKLP